MREQPKKVLVRVFKRQGRGQWAVKNTGRNSPYPPGVIQMSEHAALRLMARNRTESSYYELLDENFNVVKDGPAHLRGQVKQLADAATLEIRAAKQLAAQQREIDELRAKLAESTGEAEKPKRGRKPKTQEEDVNEDA